MIFGPARASRRNAAGSVGSQTHCQVAFGAAELRFHRATIRRKDGGVARLEAKTSKNEARSWKLRGSRRLVNMMSKRIVRPWRSFQEVRSRRVGVKAMAAKPSARVSGRRIAKAWTRYATSLSAARYAARKGTGSRNAVSASRATLAALVDISRNSPRCCVAVREPAWCGRESAPPSKHETPPLGFAQVCSSSSRPSAPQFRRTSDV
jgi:hypothetical protein